VSSLSSLFFDSFQFFLINLPITLFLFYLIVCCICIIWFECVFIKFQLLYMNYDYRYEADEKTT
jgi:hypothetical protein